MLSRLLVAVALSLSFAGISAQAAEKTESSGNSLDGRNFYVGALGGGAFVSNGLGSNLNLGANVGWMPVPNLDLGFHLSRIFLSSSDTSSLQASDKITLMLFQLNVHPFEGSRQFWLGAKAGWATSGFSGTFGKLSASDSKTMIAAGPGAGVDFPIGYGLSIGAEANLLFKGSTDELDAVVKSSRSASSIAQLLASVKYWF